MFRNFINLTFTLFLVLTTVAFANAQADASTHSGKPPKEDLPKGIQESLAKQRIEREKKDFDEMLERGEEALKLTEQLEKSFAQNNHFSTEDQKKLERLEKVVKKIRNEMGGDGDDETIENKPSSIADALKILKNGTSSLVDELKKTSRYTISVVAVQSSNALLNVVQFLRFRKN
ncbi:MAG: hypothetical protein LH472_05580 [Pyrinomonadaceae bacterium]|nr:hypothetical protein [Pyrinomonadaceae bacterium]